ncbi:MAG: acyl carrier protein [Actinomycetota bacterium]
MPDPQQVVTESIRWLMERKDLDGEITPESSIYEDLGLDSLDVAELSAMLEDNLGKDPYNEGLNPRTVGALIEWYRA